MRRKIYWLVHGRISLPPSFKTSWRDKNKYQWLKLVAINAPSYFSEMLNVHFNKTKCTCVSTLYPLNPWTQCSRRNFLKYLILKYKNFWNKLYVFIEKCGRSTIWNRLFLSLVSWRNVLIVDFKKFRLAQNYFANNYATWSIKSVF